MTLSFVISREFTAAQVAVSVSLMIVVFSGLLITSYSKKKEKRAMIERSNKTTEGKLRNNYSTVVMGYQEPLKKAPMYKRTN